MKSKVCPRCKEEKVISSFYRDKTAPNGYCSFCKVCKKQYIQNNREMLNTTQRAWCSENREKARAYTKKWELNNRDKVKAKIDRAKLDRKINPEKYRKTENARYHRIKNDPIFKLKSRIRSRTCGYFRKKSLGKKLTLPVYIGCTYEQLYTHIENKFTDGMNWERFMKADIHIDHIIPLSSAKTEQEIYTLSHYSNLQPLWAADNIRKGNKVA